MGGPGGDSRKVPRGWGGEGGEGGICDTKNTPKKVDFLPHYKTPEGGCYRTCLPPVPEKRWKIGPVEPFFRSFLGYPP